VRQPNRADRGVFERSAAFRVRLTPKGLDLSRRPACAGATAGSTVASGAPILRCPGPGDEALAPARLPRHTPCAAARTRIWGSPRWRERSRAGSGALCGARA